MGTISCRITITLTDINGGGTPTAGFYQATDSRTRYTTTYLNADNITISALKSTGNAVWGMYNDGYEQADNGKIESTIGTLTISDLTGASADGLYNLGSAKTTVTDSISVSNLQATVDDATGILNNFSTLTANGAVSVSSIHGGNVAIGIQANGGSMTVGTLQIADLDTSADEGVSVGLFAQAGTFAAQNGYGIDVPTTAATARNLSYENYGLYAEEASSTPKTVNRYAVVTRPGADVSLTTAPGSFLRGTVLAGAADSIAENVQHHTLELGGNEASLMGDIYAVNGTPVNITVGSQTVFEGQADDFTSSSSRNLIFADINDTDGSYTTHQFTQAQAGALNVAMDGGHWISRGRSVITSADFSANGGTIDLTQTSGGSVTIGALTGDAGTFRMNLSSDASKSNMLYIGSLPSNKTHTIEVVLDEGTEGAIESLVAGKTRFATTKGDYFSSDSPNAFQLSITNQGVNNWTLVASTERYSTDDPANATFNGEGTGDGSYKPGADTVNSWVGTDTATNWFVSDFEQPETPAPTPTTTLSDVGQSLFSLAHSNYWNAVEMDRLTKRLGDAQYGVGDSGLWVRVRHDSIGMNSGKGDFSQSRTMYQAGFDHTIVNSAEHVFIGAAVDYWESDTDFNKITGKGGTDRFGITAYGTWLGDSGTYADITAKWAVLSNNFNIVNSSGDTVSADYDNHVYSLGVESGHKFSLSSDKHWFIEPEGQIQYSYVTGADYRTSQGSRINQKSFQSLVSRFGFRLGYSSSEARPSSAYFKADWLREWQGNQTIRAFDATTSKNGADLSVNNQGNWFDVGLGCQAAVSNQTFVYLDGEYHFGHDLVHTWNLNAGVRWVF